MDRIPHLRINPLIDWGQNWLDVSQLDELAARQGLTYLYELLGLSQPSVIFCDGWLACAEMLQREHPDQRAYNVNQNPALLPSFNFYHRDNQFADPRFSSFFSMIAQEVTEDWHRSNKIYDLEINTELTNAMHLIMQELEKGRRRWKNLYAEVSKSYISGGGQSFYFDAYTYEMHYLNPQWLQLDATLLAATLCDNSINRVYNWTKLTNFIKAKAFVTYPLQDVVYCVRPPRFIGPTFVFHNGEEYAVPDGYQLQLTNL